MKKLLLILAVAFFAYGDLAGTYTDAISEFDYNIADTITTAYDTVSGDGDSSVIFEDFVPEKGYEYILVHAPFSGGSCDSLNIRILIRSYDYGGNILCSAYVDTVTANDCSGDAYLIPFGSGKLFGNKFDIIYQTFDPGDDPGNQVIINRAILWRRRPVAFQRQWR